MSLHCDPGGTVGHTFGSFLFRAHAVYFFPSSLFYACLLFLCRIWTPSVSLSYLNAFCFFVLFERLLFLCLIWTVTCRQRTYHTMLKSPSLPCTSSGKHLCMNSTVSIAIANEAYFLRSPGIDFVSVRSTMKLNTIIIIIIICRFTCTFHLNWHSNYSHIKQDKC